ncbi:MAG: hypothetical protein AAF280_00525 [Pseudomonadota bacterium]
MKRRSPILTLVVMLTFMASAAHAACTVEYKAKRDNPLTLFHNVTTVPGPCDRGTVQRQLRAQLAQQGLTLLKVLSISG